MAIPQQTRRVTGDRRIGARGQTAAIRGQLGLIPGIMQARQAKDIAEKQMRMDKIRLAENRRQYKQGLALQRRGEEVELGMSAGKLGYGAISTGLGGFGGSTFGDIGRKTGILSEPGLSFQPPGTEGRAMTSSVSGPGPFSSLGDFKVSSAIGSGLAGFGAGKLLGKKGKVKKGLLGAGIGALTGMFGQGGFSLGGGLGGAMFGGLGGLLS